MTKGDIIKLSGLLIVPVIVFTIVLFFLYPVINKGEFELIKENFSRNQEGLPPITRAEFDSLQVADSMLTDNTNAEDILTDITADTNSLTVEMLDSILANQKTEEPSMEVVSLQPVVDSLLMVIANLERQLDIEKQNTARLQEEAVKNQEEFADRVKSLLNLEEDELAPILERMSSKQLIKLYNSGGSVQREKILRSLNSDKAARLMSEVMS